MSRPVVFVDMLSYTGTKGGMETYTRELYRNLGHLDTGLEYVALASSEGSKQDLSWFPGEIIRSRFSGENRVVWAIGELVGSSWHADRRGASMVHSPASLGPAWTRMPVVVTLHDMLYWSHPELMTTPIYTRPVMWMERRVVANASAVITVSDVSADQIRKYLDVPERQLHVVPLAPAAKRPGLPRTSFAENLILASGQRRPHKNWERLIRALARVEESVRPRLIITGGRGDDPLRPVVDSLGLTEWVELRGWVDDDELKDLYQRARALAMPTLAEGFGLPVLEAMAAGLPVMASNLPVFREIGGDAALWFDPNDLDSIADTVRVVATQPERLAELSAAGLRQAAPYSWNRAAEETLKVFRTVLDGKTQRPKA